MTEYVLRFDKPIGFYADKLDYYEGQSNAMSYVVSYANLLSKKLEIWMFVPCKFIEGVWVVLEEPKENDLCGSFFDMQTGFHYEKEYQEAKDRVLFEGFEVVDKGKWSKNNPLSGLWLININNECRPFSYCSKGYPKEWYWAKMNLETIEDLIKYNLELTKTAQKQIGL